jgi:hypothetical protein
MRGAAGAEVSLTDTGHAFCVDVCRFYRTDADTLRIKAVRLQQPNQLTAPAPKIDDAPGYGRRQQGTDVTPVSKSSRLASACAL